MGISGQVCISKSPIFFTVLILQENFYLLVRYSNHIGHILIYERLNFHLSNITIGKTIFLLNMRHACPLFNLKNYFIQN